MEQEDNTTMTLSEIINKSKDKKGWTLKQLAQVSGASEDACRRALRDKPVHDETIQRIGKALSIPSETLWTADRPKQTRTTKWPPVEKAAPPVTKWEPLQLDLFTSSVAKMEVCKACVRPYLVIMTPANYCPICGKEVAR